MRIVETIADFFNRGSRKSCCHGAPRDWCSSSLPREPSSEPLFIDSGYRERSSGRCTRSWMRVVLPVEGRLPRSSRTEVTSLGRRRSCRSSLPWVSSNQRQVLIFSYCSLSKVTHVNEFPSTGHLAQGVFAGSTIDGAWKWLNWVAWWLSIILEASTWQLLLPSLEATTRALR